MKPTTGTGRGIVCGLLLSTLLYGCAAIERSETLDTERVLSAAGFHMKFADSADQQTNVGAMTQRTLVPHERDGEVYYVYADSKFCQCVYVGDESAYERYQRLALRKRLAEDRLQAAQMNEDAAMNWGAWGAWGPWGPWR